MIDVHIGFMDEEVSELLRHLIKNFGESRPVLAVERGKVTDEDWLFETPLRKYVSNKKEVSIISVKSTVKKNAVEKQPDSKAPLENRLAHYLYQELYSDRDFIDERIKGRVLQAEKVKLEEIQISVVRFNPNINNNNDPIILIRNPEMGMQPSIVRPYERVILKAISRLDEAHQPSSNGKIKRGVRLHSFASGGAINPDFKPGQITRPWGSLYIGSDVDEDGRVYSVVNLAAFRKISLPDEDFGLMPIHVELLRQESSTTYTSSDAPSNTSQDLLKQANDEGTELAEWYVLNCDDPLLGETLNSLRTHYQERIQFREFEKSAPENTTSGFPEITASFSYFDSLETKKKINEKFKKAVVNSNMEDYHVLRLAKSMVERGTITHLKDRGEAHKYASLAGFEILRINANVYIPPDMKVIHSNLHKYLMGAGLSREAYVSSIMWGLKGCPLDLVPKLDNSVNRWKLYEDLAKIEKDKDKNLSYFYTYNHGDIAYCMDPFCCEIATDLLKELANKDCKFLPELQPLAQGIREEARKRTWADDSYEYWKPVEVLVVRFVGEMAKSLPPIGDSGLMPCWLRPGKWKKVDSPILIPDVVEAFRGHEANVDRLFYKSANLLALQSLAYIAAERTGF